MRIGGYPLPRQTTLTVLVTGAAGFIGFQMARDFTCIDDIVESIARLRTRPSESASPGKGANRLFNVGRGEPVALLDFIECLESALAEWVDFRPQMAVETGVGAFVKWYRQFYRI
jgi:UDP-glucuronate 4-epimerase